VVVVSHTKHVLTAALRTIWWFVNLFMTGQKLKKLPYMSTRYIQLSYRFFSLQATLVTLYYLFQYVVVIVFITQVTHDISMRDMCAFSYDNSCVACVRVCDLGTEPSGACRACSQLPA
jgi:hypothetical protein